MSAVAVTVCHLRLSQKEAGSTRGLVEQWASRNWSDCLHAADEKNEDIVSDYPQWPGLTAATAPRCSTPGIGRV